MYYCINTLEAPISWGQIEPTEGEFAFRALDALIEKARAEEGAPDDKQHMDCGDGDRLWRLPVV